MVWRVPSVGFPRTKVSVQSLVKILLTTHQFFPEFSSGTEVLTLSVGRELARRGYEVRIYTGYPSVSDVPDGERFDEYVYEGIVVYRFHHAYTPMGGQYSMVELSYDNYLAAGHFRSILKNFKPDVVHFFHLNRLGTGLIEVAEQAGVPAFFTPTDFWAVCHTAQLSLPDGRLCQGPTGNGGNCVKHLARSLPSRAVNLAASCIPSFLVDWGAALTVKGYLPSYPFGNEVAALGRRLAVNVSRINRLRGIVSPNSFMTSVLKRHGVVPSLITQLAYGVDVVRNESCCSRQSKQRLIRISFIGTLAKHKGCHVLIEAFKTFSVGQAELVIYGRDTDFPEYSAYLRDIARGRSNIAFCGVFPNSEISCILADIDILVVPSLWFENTPLVVYSAHAAKCLVVASDFPGLSDVIEHEKNGLLFEAGDSGALARQLHRLIIQPGLRERLVENLQPPKATTIYVDELLALWDKDAATVQ